MCFVCNSADSEAVGSERATAPFLTQDRYDAIDQAPKSDVVDQAKTMIEVIDYADFKGIGQAYPDRTVAEVLDRLVFEIERLRGA